MTRVAIATLAVVALLGPGSGSARADDSTSTGPWSGSTLAPQPRFDGCDNDDICGQFVREGSEVFGPRSITAWFRLETVVTSVGCTAPAAPGPIGPSQSPLAFNRPLSFECNGTYQSFAHATANMDGGSHSLDRTFEVADPAPEVDPPTATATARTVEISWTPLPDAPKDFRGYTVLRTTADGETEAIATLPATETSWIDATPPEEGGELTYQVQTRRAGANPTDPTDEVSSSGASADPVEVEPAPVDPTDPTVPGDPTDPTDPTDPGDPSAPGGPSSPPPSGGRGPTSVIQVPRVGTPSRSFFPPLLSPPDTFSPTLPFEELEPGEEAAVLPDDLSSPFAEQAGRGLVIPAAVGLVLAVWAFHLRYLARMARPQYVEAGEDLPEILQL